MISYKKGEKMNFIDKLEKKFGFLGIPNLMRYIIGLNIIGAVLGLIEQNFYIAFLSLDFDMISKGQIWRLLTFIMRPQIDTSSVGSAFIDIFWFIIWIFLYYSIGRTLENAWGKFRFTLFYFSGMIFIILVTFITYLIFLFNIPASADFSPGLNAALCADCAPLNQSLFLAFAMLFPNMEFLLYLLLPIKAKWIGIIYVVLNAVTIIQNIILAFKRIGLGDWVNATAYFDAAILVFVAMLNVGIFYLFAKGKGSINSRYKQVKRRKKYNKNVNMQINPGGAIHRCAICGRTEKDDPSLEFRYCSKCNGAYEYCNQHLFTHKHVE